MENKKSKTVRVVHGGFAHDLRIFWIESKQMWCAVGNFGFMDFYVKFVDGQWIPVDNQ